MVLLPQRANVGRGLHHVRLWNEENEGIVQEWWDQRHWLVRRPSIVAVHRVARVVGFHELRERMGGKKLGVIIPAF
jgi:hypothetical protein